MATVNSFSNRISNAIVDKRIGLEINICMGKVIICSDDAINRFQTVD